MQLTRVEAITLFVEDLERAKQFYGEALGLKQIFDDDDSAVFQLENTIVNLLRVPAARELVEPGTVAGPDTGLRFQLTVPVDDVDAACEQLVARGVTLLNGPVDRPWGVRTAAFQDPAGHLWEVAAELRRTPEPDG